MKTLLFLLLSFALLIVVMSVSRQELLEMLLGEDIPSYHELINNRNFKFVEGIVYTEGNCYMNSLFNKTNGLAHLNLHLVYGSLGLGRRNPFFEYGNSEWTTINDFLTSPSTNTDVGGRTSLDAHVWLEDNAGNIYDFVTDNMRMVCMIRDLTPIDSSLTVARGETKAALQRRGLWHVAAPPAVQLQLRQAFHDSWYDTYRYFMKHFYQRVYDVHVDLSP